MAKFQIVGLDAAFRGIEAIGTDADEIAKMCVYDGAGVVADAVKRNINALPVRDKNDYGRENHKVRGVTADEKEGLLKCFGIASMRTTGDTVDTVLGFDGYIGQPTKNYPKGRAAAMIARSVESGTSWLTKSPFLKPAYNSSKSAAESAMARRFDEEIAKRG